MNPPQKQKASKPRRLHLHARPYLPKRDVIPMGAATAWLDLTP
jgi:hypothetical protein